MSKFNSLNLLKLELKDTYEMCKCLTNDIDKLVGLQNRFYYLQTIINKIISNENNIISKRIREDNEIKYKWYDVW